MKRKVLIFGLCLLEVTYALSAKDKKSIPLYKDAKVPIEKRVDDLLSRMTLGLMKLSIWLNSLVQKEATVYFLIGFLYLQPFLMVSRLK